MQIYLVNFPLRQAIENLEQIWVKLFIPLFSSFEMLQVLMEKWIWKGCNYVKSLVGYLYMKSLNYTTKI